MAVSPEQIEEMKNFFSSAKIPASVKLDDATTQHRVAEQVTEKVNLLESGTLSDVIAQTFYEKLVQIKNTLSKPES